MLTAIVHYALTDEILCGALAGVSTDEADEVTCEACVKVLTVAFGGFPLHEESADCWCAPTTLREEHGDVIVHNSKDEAN